MDNRNREKTELLEEIENDNSPIPEDTPKTETPEEPQEDVVVTEEETTLDAPIDEETGELIVTPVAKEEETQVLPDVEERYKEQRREVDIVNQRNKQLIDAMVKVDDPINPTDDDLKQYLKGDGVEWDDLSLFEKSMAKKSFISERKLAAVNEAVKGVKDFDDWKSKVDTFLDDNETKQTNKALIGREEEFKSYSLKASHRGVDLGVLTSAFLQDMKPQQRSRGSLFLTQTGGEKQVVKTDIDDAGVAGNLRVSNPREYARQLKAGKVKIVI